MLIFTFCAAVAAAASDLNEETCSISDYKEYFQSILGGIYDRMTPHLHMLRLTRSLLPLFALGLLVSIPGKCSTLRVAIAWCFFMSFLFVGSLIYSVRMYRIESNEEKLYAKQNAVPITSAQLSSVNTKVPGTAGWDDDKAEDNENFI